MPLLCPDFRVVPMSTSTYVCVLVSVCYPGLPATGLARFTFVARPIHCDGSVFLFLPVKPAPLSSLDRKPAVFHFMSSVSHTLVSQPRETDVVFFLWHFPCFLHYVRTRCMFFGRRICFHTRCFMPVLALFLRFVLCTSYVPIEASCLFSYSYVINRLALPQFFALRTP